MFGEYQKVFPQTQNPGAFQTKQEPQTEPGTLKSIPHRAATGGDQAVNSIHKRVFNVS